MHLVAHRVHPLPVGARVHHRGELWPEAAVTGTATVLEVKPQRDGTFEYLVQKDKPFLPGDPNEPTWWASYATYPAQAAGVAK